MDEQQHRRRRHHAHPQPDEQQPITAQSEAPQESAAEETHSSVENVHHRRRRAATHDSEDAPKADGSCASAGDELFWHPESALLDQEPQKENVPQKSKDNPFRLIASLDAFICRIGDFILLAIKWIGIAFLFAADAVANGVRKISEKIKRLRRTKNIKAPGKTVHTGKRIPRKEAQDASVGEVTLEPTRPQDYRGIGDKRAGGQKKRVIRAPGKRVSVAYSATMAGLICVALVSAFMVGSILWRSISTKRLNDSLSARYSQLSQTTQSEPDEYAEASAASLELSAGEDEEPLFLPIDTPTPEVVDIAEETVQPVNKPTPTPKPADAVKSTKFHQVGGDALPEMEALYQDNRDLIGWLRMEEILDLPVVYKDNEYYLTRDFYKNKSASGTLFLDENHPFRENAQNLLLHGHNMKDGTMFGRLVQYETNLQFFKNNPFIQYSTLWKKEQYVIFAVLHVSLDVHSEDFFNYFTHHTFTSDTQFDNYIRSLQNRSVYSIPIDVEPTDALLTLSTCLDDDRLVIVARRLRDGESKSELRHLVQLSARQ